MKTNNLTELLNSISGAKICSLRTKTALKANKKSRTDGTPFPYSQGISKISVRNVIIGSDYSSSINGRLAKENKVADFVPENLWGGSGRRISKFLVQHTESKKEYLSVLPITDSENKNLSKNIYIDNSTGLEVDFDSLKDFLPPYNEPTNQNDLEKTVHWLCIETKNILGLKFGENLFEKV